MVGCVYCKPWLSPHSIFKEAHTMSNFIELPAYVIPVAIGIIILVLLLLSSYVKAPPDKAYIISGLHKQPKVLIGRAGFRIP